LHQVPLVSNQLISLASRETGMIIRVIVDAIIMLVSNQLISLASRELRNNLGRVLANCHPSFQSINFPSE